MFAADHNLPSIPRIRTQRRQWLNGMQRGFAAAAVAVGVLDQIYTSSSGTGVGVSDVTKVLFELCLIASIMLAYHNALWCHARYSQGTIPRYARHLSRQVFVLLYGLAGVREIADLVGPLWIHDHPPRHHMEDFQLYVAYGVTALVLIRVLAVMTTRALRRHP